MLYKCISYINDNYRWQKIVITTVQDRFWSQMNDKTSQIDGFSVFFDKIGTENPKIYHVLGIIGSQVNKKTDLNAVYASFLPQKQLYTVEDSHYQSVRPILEPHERQKSKSMEAWGHALIVGATRTTKSWSFFQYSDTAQQPKQVQVAKLASDILLR